MKPHHQPSQKIRRPILNLLWVGMLSWMVLLVWGLSLWIQHDFSYCLNAIQALATTQISLVSTFSHLTTILSLLTPLSLGHVVAHELNPVLIYAMQVWVLLIAITHVLSIKLCIIALSIPLFFLAILAGLVDGLSQRAIRTASLGRESTYIFHKSIPVIRKVFVMLVLLWLSLPISLVPSPIFLSLAVLMGLLASLSASRFKKYL